MGVCLVACVLNQYTGLCGLKGWLICNEIFQRFVKDFPPRLNLGSSYVARSYLEQKTSL